MAVLFPSNEWCEAWRTAMNDSKAVQETGKDWGVDFNGNWVFEITPGAGLDRTTHVYLEAQAGKCTAARIIDHPSDVDAGFFCTGSYGEFKQVVKGEADFMQGVMRGTFKLTGDMAKILRNARFVRAVADSISTFEAEYRGE